MIRRRRSGEKTMTAFAGIVLAVLAGVAWLVFVLVHIMVLVFTVAAVLGAYQLGARRKDKAPVQLIQSRTADDSGLADQVAELERLAGRPLSAVIASYQTIQRQYGGMP